MIITGVKAMSNYYDQDYFENCKVILIRSAKHDFLFKDLKQSASIIYQNNIKWTISQASLFYMSICWSWGVASLFII